MDPRYQPSSIQSRPQPLLGQQTNVPQSQQSAQSQAQQQQSAQSQQTSNSSNSSNSNVDQEKVIF
jgi:hypothetical protein